MDELNCEINVIATNHILKFSSISERLSIFFIHVLEIYYTVKKAYNNETRKGLSPSNTTREIFIKGFLIFTR